MNTTICFRIACRSWEHSKEKVMEQLQNTRKVLKNMSEGGSDVWLMKDGERKIFSAYRNHYDIFCKAINENTSNDEDNIISFSDVSVFPKTENDLEEDELDFDDSLSLSVAYAKNVDDIIFQIKVDMDSDEAKDCVELQANNYDIFISINDPNSNYIEEIEI